MADDEIRLSIENVGGFYGETTLGLRRGVNRIRAPNAVGKTSVVRALELLTAEERHLRGKGHYMNLFALSPGDQAHVAVEGLLTHRRRFRRAGSDLIPVEGEPLLPGQADTALKICFALPENELVNTMLAGKAVRGYVEQLSESELYDSGIAALRDVASDFERQHQMYRSDLIRLEETERAMEDVTAALEAKREELERLPEIDETQILKDQEVRQQHERKLSERRRIEEDLADLRRTALEKEGDAESLKAEIDFYRQSLRGIGADRDRIEQELGEVHTKLQEQKENAQRMRVELAKIDDELRLVNENFQKRRKYGEEKLCIACGQPLSLKQLQAWETKLRDAAEDFQRKLREVNRKIDQLEEEEESLEEKLQRLSTFQDRLKRAERTLAASERELSRAKKDVEDLEREREELDTQIASLYRTIDESAFEGWKQRVKLSDSIAELEARLESLESRVQELQQQSSKAEDIVRKIEFTKLAIQHLERRRHEVVEAVRNRFNSRILATYKSLGFDDFSEIEVTPDYTVRITRRHDGEAVGSWPLAALSSGERITLAITFLAVAKEQFVPEYPFFVLDEVITSYDPTRFEAVAKNLADIADFVVMTELEAGMKRDKPEVLSA